MVLHEALLFAGPAHSSCRQQQGQPEQTLWLGALQATPSLQTALVPKSCGYSANASAITCLQLIQAILRCFV